MRFFLELHFWPRCILRSNSGGAPQTKPSRATLNSVNEGREICNIPVVELDKLLCNFYMTAKKKNGGEYEPDTISSIARSIQRHLDDKNFKFNILKDEAFKMSCEV